MRVKGGEGFDVARENTVSVAAVVAEVDVGCYGNPASFDPRGLDSIEENI